MSDDEYASDNGGESLSCRGAALLAGVDDVPTLHVFGQADAVVEPDRSRALVELFALTAAPAHR